MTHRPANRLAPCFIVLVLGAAASYGQDTFSLAAVDGATGEVVSAGASCLDGDVAPGGARIISSVLPGVGVLHTQSYFSVGNQQLGERLLRSGLDAHAIVDSLTAADVGGAPALRQYAAMTFGEAGRVARRAFTGGSCAPYAGQFVGTDFVVAGNILLDSLVVVRMREAFVAARALDRPLVECALAALEAVAYPGADRRCLEAGLSSRSAFLRLARPGDSAEALTLDLVVAFPEGGRDPIRLLAEAYRRGETGELAAD